MNPAALVVTTRESADTSERPPGSIDPRSIENVHYGSIAVVDVDGRLRSSIGDPERSTFTRSTLKPFQALPFVREGGPAAYGWSSREIALMCASHSGESMHTGIVASMLASTGCDATHLQCGCHVPGRYAALGRTPPPDVEWSPIEHNCSGKHAGFLASCRLHGEPVEGYLATDSPLQRRVSASLGALAGLAAHEMPSGTDGCSAPNYALPLSRLALLYARLAQGTDAADEGESLGVLVDAMTRHPELVSGTRRSDLALMSLRPGDLVTKIGADGVQAIGIRSLGLGVAVKVDDGNRDALYVAVAELLVQLGVLEAPSVHDACAPWLHTRIHNARGLAIGRIRPVFRLPA